MSTFSLTYPVGPRAAVAKAVRDGDHHAKGKHTQLDQAREFIAEQVEHTGTPSAQIELRVNGFHGDTTREIFIGIAVVDYDFADPDAYPALPEPANPYPNLSEALSGEGSNPN